MYSIVFQQLSGIGEVQECIQNLSFNRNKNNIISFRQFKDKIFTEFEERELEFQLEYEPMTPFANEEKEIQYIKELKLVGREVEYKGGIISFDSDSDEIPKRHDPENTKSDNFFSEVSQFDPSKINSKVSVIEGKEELEVEVKAKNETPEPTFSENAIKKITQELPRNEEDQGEEPFWETEEVNDSEDTFETEESSITFEEGMTLREFLRNNPTINIDDVYTYFSQQEIKKALMQGRVVKRGNKLFI